MVTNYMSEEKFLGYMRILKLQGAILFNHGDV